MRNAPSAWLPVLFIISSLGSPALAREDENCGKQSKKNVTCLCKISDLHPTQASVGMAAVRIKEEKLKGKMEEGSASDFLTYLWKERNREPVIIGPHGIFYITDHHHLARALYDLGVAETYCTIIGNRSHAKPDDFWEKLKDKKQVYLKDQNGNPITPRDLPTSIKDLSNDPFRSLAGAVRRSCGFEKGDSPEDFMEFQWADYLRAHWAQTGIATEDIDTKFDRATSKALELAAKKDADSLPGYTGETSCD